MHRSRSAPPCCKRICINDGVHQSIAKVFFPSLRALKIEHAICAGWAASGKYTSDRLSGPYTKMSVSLQETMLSIERTTEDSKHAHAWSAMAITSIPYAMPCVHWVAPTFDMLQLQIGWNCAFESFSRALARCAHVPFEELLELWGVPPIISDIATVCAMTRKCARLFSSRIIFS